MGSNQEYRGQPMTSHLKLVIEDINEKIADAKKGGPQTYESPPYYSTTPGCLFLTRVWYNGYGDYRESHISVFLRLLPGSYDDQLTWPLQGRVTISLGYDPDHLHSDDFRLDPTFSATQRPLPGTDSRAFGLPAFVKQSVLRDPRYVKDDRLEISVTVSREQ